MSRTITPVRASDHSSPVPDSHGKVTLASAVYYFHVGLLDYRRTGGIQVEWDNAVVGTLTFEDTNASEAESATDDTTAGVWIPESPPDAYVGVTGGSASGLTVTIPGGSQGGCSIQLDGFGLERGRVKLDLSTGGVVRCTVSAKDT